MLLEKLESLAFDVVAQKAAPSRLSSIPSRRKVQLNSQEDAARLNIVSNGTVLNIFRNRQQGNAMHVIVRSGEVCLRFVSASLIEITNIFIFTAFFG